jgi:hypothetical protein
VLLTTHYEVQAAYFKLSETDSEDFGYHNEQKEREREPDGNRDEKEREFFFCDSGQIQAVGICFHGVHIVLKCNRASDHTVWGSSLMLRQTEQTFGVTMSIILFCVSETIIFTGMFERQ